MDLTVGFILRNLVTEKNFIEFQDYQIFHDFQDDKCLLDLKNGIFEKNHDFGK